jgi:K+ transporter
MCVAYPSLIITYLGQAAYLMVNPENVATTFYSCIPSPVYWPVSACKDRYCLLIYNSFVYVIACQTGG